MSYLNKGKIEIYRFILTVFLSAQISVFWGTEENVMTAALERLQWYGQSSFSISGSKIIYIDPFELPAKETLKPADIIFITHPHYDHLSVKDIGKIYQTKMVIVAPWDCAQKLPEGLNVRWVKPGDQLDIDGMKAEAVPAYNLDTPYHPKENQWVGYIIHVDGISYYHAGDTDFIPEMKEVRSDVAMLPIGGTYTMKWADAVDAVAAIRPKIAIPMHYGKAEGTVEDAENFKSQSKIAVIVMNRQNS